MSHLSPISSGVAILLAPTFQPEILGVKELVPGHLLHLAVLLGSVPLHFVNVYAPRPGALQARFFEEVSALLSSIDSGECIILGGDFNCTLELGDRSGPQRGQASVEKLRGLISSLNLVDVWRNLHPDSSAFTWRSGGGGSRIDRLYFSQAYVSRVSAASMRLVPCSDQRLVWAEFTPLRTRAGSAYWHFNKRLLEDVRFWDSFCRFWADWRRKRGAFPSLRLWWDVGKTHIRIFCQEYAKGSTKRRKAEIACLEREVLDLESRLGDTVVDPALWQAYKEKGALRDLQLIGSRGVYVRLRIQILEDLDCASPFFYSLEKWRGVRKQLIELLADDGSSITDPTGMGLLVRTLLQCVVLSGSVQHGCVQSFSAPAVLPSLSAPAVLPSLSLSPLPPCSPLSLSPLPPCSPLSLLPPCSPLSLSLRSRRAPLSLSLRSRRAPLSLSLSAPAVLFSLSLSLRSRRAPLSLSLSLLPPCSSLSLSPLPPCSSLSPLPPCSPLSLSLSLRSRRAPLSLSAPAVLPSLSLSAPAVLPSLSLSAPAVLPSLSLSAPAVLPSLSLSAPAVLPSLSLSAPAVLPSLSLSAPAVLPSLSLSAPAVLPSLSLSPLPPCSPLSLSAPAVLPSLSLSLSAPAVLPSLSLRSRRAPLSLSLSPLPPCSPLSLSLLPPCSPLSLRSRRAPLSLVLRSRRAPLSLSLSPLPPCSPPSLSLSLSLSPLPPCSPLSLSLSLSLSAPAVLPSLSLSLSLSLSPLPPCSPLSLSLSPLPPSSPLSLSLSPLPPCSPISLSLCSRCAPLSLSLSLSLSLRSRRAPLALTLSLVSDSRILAPFLNLCSSLTRSL
ncbi:uncharacterized protein [Heterodontus francisci]|uniref:uncharacterized protein n=1 Tax=Heterodontus francisci TaxID=7792 RepID=UPI00355B485E